MSNSNNPIGVFDSGVGGLSILKEIKASLPNENLIYFADSANCPYGTKNVDELKRLVEKVVNFLVQKKCKLIVVACNSVTATLIEELRNNYKVPFIGIEPATLVAARNTKKRSIGVLATKTTAESRLFQLTKQKIDSDIRIRLKIGQGLVELVEDGELSSSRAKEAIRANLEHFKGEVVDQIVLGCTHYPFLLPLMKKELPSCEFIDPAPAVIKQLNLVLGREQMLNTTKSDFCDIYFSAENKGLDVLLKKSKLHTLCVKKYAKL